MKNISSALISVYDKEGLEPILKLLKSLDIKLYSTGGTQVYIESLGVEVTPVEDVTGYPSILGGRVKTLHPGVMGGILYRREEKDDLHEIKKFNIPSIDLVVVDLYPFEETLKKNSTHEEIIEKIDVGGITLIRAAAKNFNDTLVVSHKNQYPELLKLLQTYKGMSSLDTRRHFAREAFGNTSNYDASILNYFSGQKEYELRYGENPHQTAKFKGNLESLFTRHNGKDLSYNNLLDIDSAINLRIDFKKQQPMFVIIKHNNACGLAIKYTVYESYMAALEADPVSAFGGVLCCNSKIDVKTALEMDKLFFEILIADAFEEEALNILKSKKNRIILEFKEAEFPSQTVRSVLNGVLVQDRDSKTETVKDLRTVTVKKPTEQEIADLFIANVLVKNTKSNAIILVKNGQLLGSGTGQTSRVDALNQAIHKARHFGFDLAGAVMASDAFFPFPDCVEIAHGAGISSVIQPGGSIKDQLSIEYCDSVNMSMVMTGFRHFKH